MKRHEVDTQSVSDVDMISVDLWYPRNEDRYKSIQISLMDVRAANDIEISYDFERDGWVIKSDLVDPRGTDEYTQEEWDALPEVEGQPGVKNLVSDSLYEVAFIPAWPQRRDYPDVERSSKDVREGGDS